MPAGFQSISSSGLTQIDSNFQNYVESDRDSISGGWGNINYVGAADGSNLFFIWPAKTTYRFYAFGGSAGGFIENENYYWPSGGTFAVVSTTAGSYGHGPGTPEFDWITLANTAAVRPIDRGYGFQVFDTNGRIAFDATANYLKIAGIFYMPQAGGVITLPSPAAGKKYYALLNNIIMTGADIHNYSGGSADEQTYGLYIQRTSDNTYRVGTDNQHYTEYGGGGDSWWLDGRHRACVIIMEGD